MLLLLALLSACDPTGSWPGACPDAESSPADCEIDRLAAAWPTDPGRVLDAVREEADPLRKARLVEAMSEAHPGEVGALCAMLPEGPTRSRCTRIESRPHLWKVDPSGGESLAPFIGEARRTLAPSASFHAPQLPAAQAATCEAEVPERSCRAQRALEAALAQDLAGSAALCAGMPDGRWRSACLVEAVELGCQRADTRPCGMAAELCLAAPPFRELCLSRLATELAASAPSAEDDRGDRWASLSARQRELRLRMQAVDPILGDRMVHRVWAQATQLSYGAADRIGGNPLDHVPMEAAPHVRAALAWRLHRQSGRQDGRRDLADRAQEVVQATQRRVRRAGARPLTPSRLPMRGFWDQDLPGEADIPWIAWLEGPRRALAADPLVDARICVLEAAARAQPVDDALLVEGLADTDALVRWTAARLLAQLRPGHAALGFVRDDPDPRVRARAGG